MYVLALLFLPLPPLEMYRLSNLFQLFVSHMYMHIMRHVGWTPCTIIGHWWCEDDRVYHPYQAQPEGEMGPIYACRDDNCSVRRRAVDGVDSVILSIECEDELDYIFELIDNFGIDIANNHEISEKIALAAAKCNNVDMLQLLHESGASLELCRSQQKATLMHIAFQYSHIDVFNYFIYTFKDFESPLYKGVDDKGFTFIHYMVLYSTDSFAEAIGEIEDAHLKKYLLGAMLNVNDNKGRGALDIGIAMKRNKKVDVLRNINSAIMMNSLFNKIISFPSTVERSKNELDAVGLKDFLLYVKKNYGASIPEFLYSLACGARKSWLEWIYLEWDVDLSSACCIGFEPNNESRTIVECLMRSYHDQARVLQGKLPSYYLRDENGDILLLPVKDEQEMYRHLSDVCIDWDGGVATSLLDHLKSKIKEVKNENYQDKKFKGKNVYAYGAYLYKSYDRHIQYTHYSAMYERETLGSEMHSRFGSRMFQDELRSYYVDHVIGRLEADKLTNEDQKTLLQLSDFDSFGNTLPCADATIDCLKWYILETSIPFVMPPLSDFIIYGQWKTLEYLSDNADDLGIPPIDYNAPLIEDTSLQSYILSLEWLHDGSIFDGAPFANYYHTHTHRLAVDLKAQSPLVKHCVSLAQD